MVGSPGRIYRGGSGLFREQYGSVTVRTIVGGVAFWFEQFRETYRRHPSSRARSVSVAPVRASSSSGVVLNMLFVSPAAG